MTPAKSDPEKTLERLDAPVSVIRAGETLGTRERSAECSLLLKMLSAMETERAPLPSWKTVHFGCVSTFVILRRIWTRAETYKER